MVLLSICQATELLADGSPGIGGRYMAIADVRISITDVNDNVPMFSPAMYQVNMEESLANGATILGLNIRVFDQDQVIYNAPPNESLYMVNKQFVDEVWDEWSLYQEASIS